MIKTIMSTLLVLILSACGGDNSFDGETGLPTQTSTSSGVEGIKEILLNDAKENTLKAEAFSVAANDLAIAQNASTIEAAQTAFLEFVKTWKTVETLYIAGDIDNVMIDIERFIDIFHSGNENIKAQLDVIFSGSGNVENALFRNSNKSINAAQYTLFANADSAATMLTNFTDNGARRAEALVVIAQTLKAHSKTISDFYEADTDFVRDDKASIENLVNQLIDSSYKLKEWRVGEPAGLVVKYAGDPNASRLEYFDSAYTAKSIEAILLAHKNLFEPDSQDGLSAYMASEGASSQASFIVAKIDTALIAIRALPTPLKSQVPSAGLTSLYNATVDLHNAYFVTLVLALNITPALIEADGD